MRHYSDIPWPYGVVAPDPSAKARLAARSSLAIKWGLTLQLEQKDLQSRLQAYSVSKTRPIAWFDLSEFDLRFNFARHECCRFVSHCHTTSKREKIVSILRNYIEVLRFLSCTNRWTNRD